MNIKNLFLNHQQKIVLITGYVLVAILAFSLGRITFANPEPPEIRVEEAFLPLNNTENLTPTQSNEPQQTPRSQDQNCNSKIKGNISAKGDKIYHMPGGSFYNRTIPEMCFSTEDEARAAGFRKSSR